MFDYDYDYVYEMVTEIGRVESLHLHPKVAGEALQAVGEVYAEAGKGLVGDARVFGRKNQKGEPSRRQVSLIAREEIARHAAVLGLTEIPPGKVRSNIETTGIDLVSLIGREMEVGQAVMLFYEARTPCWKMERIAPGLQARMSQGRQGVLAQVLRSGWIRAGDAIRPVGQINAKKLPTP
jgi:MOSC domain-containing protein YiiM